MARLNLRLLGDFEARLGSGPPLRLRARKTQALLAYLASSPGHTHSRDKLASLLWGDSSQSQARSRLRGSLFVLRRTLASAIPPCLVLDSDAVALDVDAVDIDVVDFGRLVRVHDPEALAKAVELYRGDLLEGFAFRGALFEEWLIAERERLREMAIDGLAKLLVHQRSTGAFEAAVQTGLRLVALDPLQESVHRTLMRLYAELGRRPAALRQYQMCVRVLQRELRVEPDAETKRLYRELVRWQPHSAPNASLHNRHDAEQLVLDGLSKDTVLIGREVERAQLRQALEEAAGGHGHVVTVVGEAGIGKTSVLDALAREAIALRARVLVGRCYESASILPFGPWVDAFRSGQTLDDETLDALHPVWRSELARLLPEANTAGLPAPSDNVLRLFEGVAHFIETLATRRALVLMLEDIHWADEMSLRLLAFMSRRTARCPVLVLTTAREQELVDAAMARRTLEELGRAMHSISLKLAPLSRPDTALLVRSLSHVGTDAAALTRLEDQVWVVSEGNPFVVVETMRALDEGSIVKSSTSLPLPKRVREVIADRVSRLSDRGRQLAAVAAVIGREFDFALFQRASGCDEVTAADGVEELVRRGVLQGTDDRFDFTHDRIRAVINAELLPPHRKLLHRQVGAALEALHADDLETQSAALGTHYRVGEVWDKALVYCRQAGEKAMARSAFREAVGYFERALIVLSHLPETRAMHEQAIDLRLALRSALSPASDLRRVLACLHEAEALAEALDDRRRLGQISIFLSLHFSMVGAYDQGVAAATRALALATASGDVILQALANRYLGEAYHIQGDYRRAIACSSQTVASLDGARCHEHFGQVLLPAVTSRARLALCHAELGMFAEGNALGEEGLRIAETVAHPASVMNALWGIGLLALRRGDLPRALPFLEQAARSCRDADFPLFFPWIAAALGAAYVLAGRVAEAVLLLTQAMAQTAATGMAVYQVLCRLPLGEAHMLAGRLQEAHALAEPALALARQHQERGNEAYALRLLGEIAARREPPEAEPAETFYHQALALADELGMRPLVAHCHFGLGKFCRRMGKREQALEHLTTATTMYREMGMTYWLEKAHE